MPVPVGVGQLAPYAVSGGQTNLNLVDTASGSVCEVTCTLHFTGTVAQIQADWATLAATNFGSLSTVLRYGHARSGF